MILLFWKLVLPLQCLTQLINSLSSLKTQSLAIDKLLTERLILVPFTIQICKHILIGDFSDLQQLGIKCGNGWPDADVLETLPKIIKNLSEVDAPTGFESWMIIKKDTLTIIGDAGFKGFNHQAQNADIGYGIIMAERRQGYAEEAVTALINWAFSNEIVKEITARCLIPNINSISLLQKLKFIELKRESQMIYWSLPKNKL